MSYISLELNYFCVHLQWALNLIFVRGTHNEEDSSSVFTPPLTECHGSMLAHISQISRGWRQSEVLNKNFKGKPYLDNLLRRGLSRTHCKDTQKTNGLSYSGQSHAFAQEKPNPLLPIYLYKCKHMAHADRKAYFKVAKEMQGCESGLQQVFPSFPEIIPLPADTLPSAYRQVFSFQQYTKAHHNRSDCPKPSRHVREDALLLRWYSRV